MNQIPSAEKIDEVLIDLIDALAERGITFLRCSDSIGSYTTRVLVRDCQQWQTLAVIDEIMSPVTMQRLDHGLWEITA